MTSELLAEEGLEIEGDFEALMEAQRERGRAGAGARARRAARAPTATPRAARRARSPGESGVGDALHRL